MSHVRELPPLRLHVEAVTPKGNRYRWGDDERNPANIPSGLSFSSTMPGGYEQLDVTLARKAGVDYSDLDRLSTLRVRGAGGDIAWEGRLERTPSTSGDQMAISPSAVGWQAHLEDDKSARMIYVDRDLNRWGQMSVAQRLSLVGSIVSPAPWRVYDPTNGPDSASGFPAVIQSIRLEGGSASPRSESLYDAGPGLRIASVYYDYVMTNGSTADPVWGAAIRSHVNDDQTGGQEDSTDFAGVAVSGSGTFTPSTPRRYVSLIWLYASQVAASAGVERTFSWRKLALFGDHGLTKRGTAPDQGFYASDIVTHAIGQWAPLLTIDSTVQDSSFVIPHLAFADPTTAGEIIRQATSFGLQDWAVWEDRTFYWAQRGTYGRKWRARIAPAQLSETGPQLDRLWESVIVSYNDVDGTTRTVGPPGSGADTEDAVLHDSDPDNPANQLGLIRRDLLSMGTSTAAGAVEVGRRFLEEQKLLDSSGQAQLVGHVTDDHGVLHPYWRIRAGDQISFVDASDTSYRRIVRASHDHGSRTCTVDLDAPPEGLDALLARLGVVLVPLGVAA